MDVHALEYYSTFIESSPHGHFHQVIPLHGTSFSFEEASKICPKICRGWVELSHLSTNDKVEFTRDYWCVTLPFHPRLTSSLNRFFSQLDDIGIFLVQRKYDDPFEAHIVYSLSDNGGFFYGQLPATEEEIVSLQASFPEVVFPPDYLAFLKIHNGFAKLSDTGIIPIQRVRESYFAFRSMLEEGKEPITTEKGGVVSPHALIPFYESFGMPFFQCFWNEWHPELEMGNVYYSALTRSISDPFKSDESSDALAFATFIDWLLFYLEKVS